MRALLYLAALAMFMCSWYLAVHPKLTTKAQAQMGLPPLNPAGERHAAGDRAAIKTRAVKEHRFKARRLLQNSRQMFNTLRYADCAKTLDLALTLTTDDFTQQEMHYQRYRCRRALGKTAEAIIDLRDACLKGKSSVCAEYRMAQESQSRRRR
jgi:hypothetical protein